MNLANYNKLWVALAGFIAQIIAQGLISGEAAAWTSAVVAAITAAGVFAAPNKTD